MFRTELVSKIGLRDAQPGIRVHQDYEYVLRLLANFNSVVVNENTYNYHVHNNSALTNFGESPEAKVYYEQIMAKYRRIFKEKIGK